LKEDREKKREGRHQLFFVPFAILEASSTGRAAAAAWIKAILIEEFDFFLKEEKRNDLEPESSHILL